MAKYSILGFEGYEVELDEEDITYAKFRTLATSLTDVDFQELRAKVEGNSGYIINKAVREGTYYTIEATFDDYYANTYAELKRLEEAGFKWE